MKWLEKWAAATRRLKGEVYTLYLAYKDKRTPWYARLFSAAVVAYAFSPIDLIPDFIPILGYLDDFLLIPLGVYIAMRLIPAEVMADSRLLAKEALEAGKPVMRTGALIVAAIWILLAILGIYLGSHLLKDWLNPPSGA
jgi:uncharacterized membrane protein YkvA (DUF1232 family)